MGTWDNTDQKLSSDAYGLELNRGMHNGQSISLHMDAKV